MIAGDEEQLYDPNEKTKFGVKLVSVPLATKLHEGWYLFSNVSAMSEAVVGVAYRPRRRAS